MAGIPSHLLISLRKALLACDQFAKDKSLYDLFADERLALWRISLPEADGRAERVDSTISYLHDKKNRDGSNGLVLLLLVLAERMDETDERRETLQNLAGQLGASGAAVPAPSQLMDTGRSQVPASGGKSAEVPLNAASAEERDFFISYNSHDRDWAEWIAWQLENAGYTTFIQAWDFRPGGNFVADMQEAAEKSKRTIAVLSETYLKSQYTLPEWNAAFAQDPTGKQGLLLPVKVRECDLKGLLSQIVYIDLRELSAEQAAERLLAGIDHGRAKPLVAPNFPGSMPRAEPPLPAHP